MKKSIIKIFSLILALTLGVSLVACDNNSGDDSGENNNVPNTDKNSKYYFDEFESLYGEYVDNTLNKEIISNSDVVFYNEQNCDYKIVISNNEYSKESELRAAKEVQLFVKEATGHELEIIRDNNADFIQNNSDGQGGFTCADTKKYISIGYTKIYNERKDAFNQHMKFSVLGNDGFCIKTFGSLVVMNAIGNNGIIYSAYGFLERMVDFEYYAYDTWTLTDDKSRNLKNMDIVEIPDFAARNLDASPTHGGTPEYSQRLRNHGSQGGGYVDGMESSGWHLGDESMAGTILDYDVYKEHSRWYSGNMKTGQICFTTLLKNEPAPEDGMRPFDEFVKNLITIIKEEPYKRIFMLGINDHPNFCKCDDCFNETLKIKYSGQMCLVANAVADAVENWQNGGTTLPSGASLPQELILSPDDFHTNREIQIAFFAYQVCFIAPVVYDPSTDTTEVIKYDAPYECLGGNGTEGDGSDDDLYLRDNIVLRVAPIDSYNMRPHYDAELNVRSRDAFIQWQLVSSKMAVWDYGTNFKDYLSYYPDLYTIQDNLKFYRYCGVTDILTQLPAHTTGTSFFALKLYVRSKLMWDIDQDIEELINDFINVYYGKQAYSSIKAYLDFVTNYFYMMDSSYTDENGDVIKGFINPNGVRIEFHAPIYDTNISDSDHFPMPIVLKMRDYFNQAIEQLDKDKTTETNYDLYYKHIQVESLWSRYMELENYRSFYSADERSTLIDEFESYASLARLVGTGHSGMKNNIPSKIANWRIDGGV